MANYNLCKPLSPCLRLGASIPVSLPCPRSPGGTELWFTEDSIVQLWLQLPSSLLVSMHGCSYMRVGAATSLKFLSILSQKNLHLLGPWVELIRSLALAFVVPPAEEGI